MMPTVRKISRPADETPPAEAPLMTVAALDDLRRHDVAPAQDAPALPDIDTLLVVLEEIDDNPYQPRLVYDDERIAAIAESITQHGLLQTPLARWAPGGRYQLAFGHSRLRAYRQLAAADTVRFGRMPLNVRTLDDETMALHAWIENRDRKDLTAYEEANAIARYTTAFGWSQKQAAARLQLTQPTIANKLRLLRLPEAALAQLRDGQLSERQAAALLPLIELPEAARAININHWIGSGYIKSVNDLFAQAAQFDSATLRKLADIMLDRLTIPLAKQPWRNDAAHVAGVVAARCADCPIRLKSSDRCPDKACADLKEGAQKASRASAAAAAVGLPTTIHTNYTSYDDLSGVNLKALRAKAAEKKCGNLAVQYSESAYAVHPVKDHPGCRIVCGHGPNKRCGCKQSLNRSADPTASADAKKRHERARIKQELIAPAEAAVAAALAQPTDKVWRRLLESVNSRAAGKLARDADQATILAALAAALVDNQVSYYLEYSPEFSTARAKLNNLLFALGVAQPWPEPEADHSRANTPADVDPLAELRTALAAIEAWMDEDEEETPELALQVNLNELAAIRARLEALSDAPDVDDDAYAALSAQISQVEHVVRALLPVASEVAR